MVEGNDPCDEMVSMAQIIELLEPSLVLGIGGYYERTAAILGVSREEAKRQTYQYLYSGGR